jgi:hypothetical protein
MHGPLNVKFVTALCLPQNMSVTSAPLLHVAIKVLNTQSQVSENYEPKKRRDLKLHWIYFKYTTLIYLDDEYVRLKHDPKCQQLTRTNITNGQYTQTTTTSNCTYLIRKLRHVIGHRPALVLPRAHVISLGVLLPPWACPITLAGTILYVSKLLWARSVIACKHDMIMVNRRTEQNSY